jgi:mRNA interferase RelE/StbE
MSYQLVYTQRAARDIERLDPIVKRRLGNTLLRYKEDPFRYAEKLSDPKLGTYRFRIGDYRVIFDLDETDIVVLRIGHRKEIYRRI